MKIKEYEKKVNNSIEIVDVLDKVKPNIKERPVYEEQKKRSLSPRLGFILAPLALALIMISLIPIIVPRLSSKNAYDANPANKGDDSYKYEHVEEPTSSKDGIYYGDLDQDTIDKISKEVTENDYSNYSLDEKTNMIIQKLNIDNKYYNDVKLIISMLEKDKD